jgi:hypothetical protein
LELLDKNVTVHRGRDAFQAAGRQFTTGTALVDGASLAARGVDIAASRPSARLRLRESTAIPVAHHEMERPKIGVYSQAPSDPEQPVGAG